MNIVKFWYKYFNYLYIFLIQSCLIRH